MCACVLVPPGAKERDVEGPAECDSEGDPNRPDVEVD